MRSVTGRLAAMTSVALLCVDAMASQPVDARDGVWSGRTSQGREIEVVVRSGGIASIKVTFVLTLDTPCPSAPGSVIGLNHRIGVAKKKYREPIPIANGRFK